MAVHILRGPAGAGKSQWLDRNVSNALRFDVTPLWAALRGLERDEDGRYPVRVGDDDGLRTALYLRSVAIGFAAREGIEGWVTTSSSAAQAVERLRETGATGRIVTVDPGLNTAMERLTIPKDRIPEGFRIVSDGDGRAYLLDECDDALGRWYQRSPISARIIARKYGLATRRR